MSRGDQQRVGLCTMVKYLMSNGMSGQHLRMQKTWTRPPLTSQSSTQTDHPLLTYKLMFDY